VTVSPAEIEHSVINLLRFHEADTAMLFCATRDNVRRLHASLVERGFAAVALSGEHSQSERNHALQALRDRRARVCVATDVAARGIDLPSLSLVIHVELPRDAERCSTVRADRARGQEGHGDPDRPLPAPQAGGRRAARGADCRGVDPGADRRGHSREGSRAAAGDLLEPVEADDEDRELGAMLLAQRSPQEVAAAWCARTAPHCRARRNCWAGGRAAGRRARPGPARRVRGHDLVPDQCRAAAQCRSALAAALAVPARPHHQE
jgi:ATP-dependent RNA helicase DeaD